MPEGMAARADLREKSRSSAWPGLGKPSHPTEVFPRNVRAPGLLQPILVLRQSLRRAEGSF